MYKISKTQKVKNMKSFFAAIVVAFFIVGLHLLAALIYEFLPWLGVFLLGVFFVVIILELLSAIEVIEYDLSKLWK